MLQRLSIGMKRQDFGKRYETPIKKWQQMSPLDDDLAIIESQDSSDEKIQLFHELVWHTPALHSRSSQLSSNQYLSDPEESQDTPCEKMPSENQSQHTVNLMRHQSNNPPKRVPLAPIDTNRKGCNCRHSKCQKQYCECFRAGMICMEGLCNCCDCQNLEHKEIHNQISEKLISQQNLPSKGCRCKKSKCLKKYCECHSNGRRCLPQCECIDCQNLDLQDKENNQPPMLSANISRNLGRNYGLNV